MTRFTVEPEYKDAELETLSRLEPLIDVLQVAVLAIHEVAQQRAEAKYWRELYSADLNRQIKHNDAMMGNVLRALIDRPVAQ